MDWQTDPSSAGNDMMNIEGNIVTLYLLPEIWDLLLVTSCCDNIPDYGKLREGGLFWCTIPSYRASLWGSQGGRELKQLFILHLSSRAESDELVHAGWYSADSVLFVH